MSSQSYYAGQYPPASNIAFPPASAPFAPLYPPAPLPMPVDKFERLRAIAAKYEINEEFVKKLHQLEGFEIVCLFDDSGSMNEPAAPGKVSAFSKTQSRWDEAKTSAGIIVDIASVFDPTGIDIYFLNRPAIRNITGGEQLINTPQFANLPSGSTPLAKKFREILTEKAEVARERKLLIIIATDGAPTNDHNQYDIPGFKLALESRNPMHRIFVTIMACTDDEEAVGYLNKWDKKMKNLDVVDDYFSEKKEIQKAKGSKYRFSHGDYIVKALLGSIDKSFDRLDEKKKSCTIM